MRVLVTGASGFIGRNLLLATPRDWRVVATYLNSSDFPAFLARYDLAHVEACQVDLLSDTASDVIRATAGDFDGCIHLAANGDPAASVAQPLFDLRSNTVALLNGLDRIPIRRFVYLSSGAVYDGRRGAVDPTSSVAPLLPYAISKNASESYVRFLQHAGQFESFANVRFFGAFGPFEPARKIYTKLVETFGIARDRRFVIRGNGMNLIDAMFVDDAVRALLLLLSSSESETLDLYSGSRLTVNDLVRRAAAVFKIDPIIEHAGDVPEFIEFFSTDETMTMNHGFIPSISLEEGLLRLAAFKKGKAGDHPGLDRGRGAQ